MRNADGVIVQWNAICLDIEDQVRAQEALRLAQEKMVRASQAASLAELSASIAHEVNQPLAAVVANSHACQRWLTSDPPNLGRAQMTVDRIIRDANSAADVVSRIRALFKRSMQSRNTMAIGDIVAEVCELMAEEKMRRRVRTNVEVDPDVPLIALDRVQIQQVLTNLMRNGLEAMDGIPQNRSLDIRVRKDGDVVRVEVCDKGQGIVHAEKIFDAFFSTKESGMGMGLAVSRSIVESHGGRLWAEGGSEGGATFIFTLPIDAPESS
jgi:C4-dicarboxylate-specific signal transduction histidine kinase